MSDKHAQELNYQQINKKLIEKQTEASKLINEDADLEKERDLAELELEVFLAKEKFRIETEHPSGLSDNKIESRVMAMDEYKVKAAEAIIAKHKSLKCKRAIECLRKEMGTLEQLCVNLGTELKYLLK